ncbi:ubiquitinyl hydrolase 1 [Arthrobotrys conoides]|uniref:Ubiquitinyl hydrolase 1 n=1 Tax=Arthrobotrys conoides TaxID=74498 RepID=A0AAN8NG66_9PEZI
MAALVNFLKSKIVGRHQDRCLILGIDAAGKTTFLYKCVLPYETITTIPTIGFNVETIKVKDSDLTLWDVGGCDKIRPLIRHYFSPGMAILFVLNIHDERLAEAMEELGYQISSATRDFDIGFVGIMLNKQDLPNTTPELREKCRKEVEGIMSSYTSRLKWRIFDSNGLSSVTGTGVQDVLHGIYDGLRGWVPDPQAESVDKPVVALPDVILTRDDLLKRIKSLRETKGTIYRYPDTYLDKMKNGKLETWDHGDHLFVASVILHKVLEDPSQTTTPQQPVFAAVDIFLEHLLSMLQEAPGKFRNTAHRTLTTFWVYQVYLAMHRFEEPAKKSALSGWPERFFFMLEQNPDLMNGRLWQDYYSKNYLFSPKAKDNLVTPDVQHLPSIDSGKPTTQVSGYNTKRLEEDYNARRIKRWAYATLQTVKATNARRGLIVKKALSELQQDTIRQRAKSPTLEPYSETQAYFWIQIVHAGMEGILKKSPTLDFARVSYDTIEILYPDAFGQDDLWKQYYAEADWKGLAARVNFIPPKRGKVIPNFTPALVLEENWKLAVSEVHIPTLEELTQRANYISSYEVKKEDPTTESTPSSSTPMDVHTGQFREEDDDDDWVEVQDITAKASQVKISEPERLPVEPAGPQTWQDQAELIHQVFNKLPKTQSQINHSFISRIAYDQVNTSWSRLTYDPVNRTWSRPPNTTQTSQIHSQVTKKTFWVRMIIEAYIDTYGVFSELDIEISLQDFLSKNLELCWEDLWMVYYNELTWKSVTADEMILGCDRKQLKSVRRWKERAPWPGL